MVDLRGSATANHISGGVQQLEQLRSPKIKFFVV